MDYKGSGIDLLDDSVSSKTLGPVKSNDQGFVSQGLAIDDVQSETNFDNPNPTLLNLDLAPPALRSNQSI